jgi:4,5-DOPA dioxygenase extradiol
MPAIFFGHGNPMNALAHNAYTEGWAAIGRSMPTPKAILSISAHWYVPKTLVTEMSNPRTIHDFGGFPEELYEVEYPAPGDPALACRVQELIASLPVGGDQSWGLDHGTWAVLCHVFPQANIPIVQLSIDKTQPAAFHYKIGQQLSQLRDEGVLIVGSGNVVHNLHAYAWGAHPAVPFDWALDFEQEVCELLMARNEGPLVDYETLGRSAMLSVPTPDHYLPLLYLIALRREGDRVNFPVKGIEGGSISMLSVQMG